MLVVSRKRNEPICIGDNVSVTIVDIRGDKVRIGIDAPTDIPVHRQEVRDRIGDQGLQSLLIVLPKNIAEQASRKASLNGQTVEHFLSLMIGIGLANEQNSKGVSVED